MPVEQSYQSLWLLHQGVQCVTAVASVEKELRNGRPWCTSVFRFDETSPVDAPRWERVSAEEAGQE